MRPKTTGAPSGQRKYAKPIAFKAQESTRDRASPFPQWMKAVEMALMPHESQYNPIGSVHGGVKTLIST